MKNSVKRIYLVSNSHIDPVWLWKRNEGIWVIRNTVRKVIEFLERNKEVTFAFSSAYFYEIIERIEPKLFEKIKKLVKDGRWIIVGGWWVEPDCNLPHGESFVRQALYGKKYFKEKFGINVEIGYNIDSFGHNAMLPQILMKSDYKYYVFMRPKPNEKELPLDLFWWVAPDGSRVLAYRIPISCTYHGDKIKELLRLVLEIYKGKLPSVLCLYGKGDHGEGPCDEDVKAINEFKNETDVEVIHSNFIDFFNDVINKVKIPIVCDELQHHSRGCYSVHHDIKKLNRQAEHSLLVAERLATLSALIIKSSYPKEQIEEAWKNVLFAQFHDSLDGTCIPEAYDDVKEMLYTSLNISKNIIENSIHKIASNVNLSNIEKALIVFNPIAKRIKVPIEIEPLWRGDYEILDLENNKVIPYQYIQPTSLAKLTRVVTVIELPPLGYKVFRLVKKKPHVKEITIKASKYHLENKRFKLRIDPKTGFIAELYDKESNTTVFKDLAAKILVIEDKGDTWAHDISKFDKVIGVFKPKEIKLIEYGPIRARIRVISEYNRSIAWIDYIMYSELDYIELRLRIEWFEKNKMLKLEFPVNVFKPKLTCEIPYGIISRPLNGEEEFMLRWIDITGKTSSGMEYGVCIINDGVYSYSAENSTIRLTLLRNPLTGHHDPLKPVSRKEYYYTDTGIHEFRLLIIPHKGDWKNVDVATLSEVYNINIPYVIDDAHEGSLPLTYKLLEVSEKGVFMSVLKRSEKGDDLVLRLYEYHGENHKVNLKLPMLKVNTEIRIAPYEIKTIKISKKGEVKETNLLEEKLEP